MEEDNVVAMLTSLLSKKKNASMKTRVVSAFASSNTTQQKIQIETVKAIKDTITPAIALAVKVKLNLSNKKYKSLRRLLQEQWNPNKQRYTPRKINNTDLSFPSLLPSIGAVKKFANSLT